VELDAGLVAVEVDAVGCSPRPPAIGPDTAKAAPVGCGPSGKVTPVVGGGRHRLWEEGGGGCRRRAPGLEG
jgi:hypothetical protein